MAEGPLASDEVLTTERTAGGAAVLTLDRPKARNALSLALIGKLQDAIAEFGGDPQTGAVVIAANGPVFSSGHDLKEMTAHRDAPDGGRAFFAETMTSCSALMQAIVNCPKAVIAAVEGAATAAGCQLVASCDLAVAGKSAVFATPGVNIGLFCSTPMVALTRAVPRKRAMEMLLLGENIAAIEAAEYGLINRIVDDGAARASAIEIAERIAAKSKSAVKTGKAAFYRQIELPLKDAYDYAAEVMVRNMMTGDANEGICAFLEKRAPDWKDD